MIWLEIAFICITAKRQNVFKLHKPKALFCEHFGIHIHIFYVHIRLTLTQTERLPRELGHPKMERLEQVVLDHFDQHVQGNL